MRTKQVNNDSSLCLSSTEVKTERGETFFVFYNMFIPVAPPSGQTKNHNVFH